MWVVSTGASTRRQSKSEKYGRAMRHVPPNKLHGAAANHHRTFLCQVPHLARPTLLAMTIVHIVLVKVRTSQARCELSTALMRILPQIKSDLSDNAKASFQASTHKLGQEAELKPLVQEMQWGPPVYDGRTQGYNWGGCLRLLGLWTWVKADYARSPGLYSTFASRVSEKGEVRGALGRCAQLRRFSGRIRAVP